MEQPRSAVDRSTPAVVGVSALLADAPCVTTDGPDTTPATVPPAVHTLTAEAETAATPYRLVTRVHLSARSHRSPHVR
ncbi:hypothetical protein [Streptomyces sp. NPDC059668]|uniref:hypothetical protein n=1 Tax=Streptomyces sp. NPDC059668 TaxID=3346900 RepID=UPI0036CA709C